MGIQPLVFWFTVVWFSAVISALLFVLVTSSVAAATPLLQMLGLGAATVAFCRFLARNQKNALVEFVSDSVDARPVGENLAVTTVS